MLHRYQISITGDIKFLERKEILYLKSSFLSHNQGVQQNKWFGIDKIVSLVDRHEYNGVGPTNKFFVTSANISVLV